MTGVSGDDKNNSEVFQLFHRGVCFVCRTRREDIRWVDSRAPDLVGRDGFVGRRVARVNQLCEKGKGATTTAAR